MPDERSEFAEALPKTLPGAVCVQWRKCGKPNCHCTRGERLHGPYFYRMWQERGRLRKAYVKRGELDAVRAACEARRREQRQFQASLWALQEVARRLREVEQG